MGQNLGRGVGAPCPCVLGSTMECVLSSRMGTPSWAGAALPGPQLASCGGWCRMKPGMASACVSGSVAPKTLGAP